MAAADLSTNAGQKKVEGSDTEIDLPEGSSFPSNILNVFGDGGLSKADSTLDGVFGVGGNGAGGGGAAGDFNEQAINYGGVFGGGGGKACDGSAGSTSTTFCGHGGAFGGGGGGAANTGNNNMQSGDGGNGVVIIHYLAYG